MAVTIPIAHDFTCPWCWVGLFQAQRLRDEYGAKFEWLGYELYPVELAWPDHPSITVKTDRPPTPTRFELLLACENMTLPKVDRPKRMRSHNAHEAVEYAKTEGAADPFVEALYRAYWEQGEEINDLTVLRRLGEGHLKDPDAMVVAVEERRFKDKIVGFDEDAHRHGVWNVPTFFIDGGRLAEQPYVALKRAIEGARTKIG